MMYSAGMVCALKVNGKVLREFGETVYVPFGSEFTILLKNQAAKRASVKISIDGEDIADGDSFVVGPNSSVEIERFLRSNNSQGNRFKFIERSGAVEQHRGVGAEDGLVRVEYQFERPVVRRSQYSFRNVPTSYTRGLSGSNSDATLYSSEASLSTTSMNAPPQNEAGVTVEGSVSNQQFQTVSSFPLEPEVNVMVLRMLGETADNKVVREPVLTTSKPQCKTCGTKASSSAQKFCSECGTSLIIV